MRKATPSKENALTKDRRSSLRLAVKNSAVVIVSLGVATAITELFYRLNLGPQNAILLFVLAIFLIAALTDGYLYCLCATAVGVFLFDFLITEPRLDFSYTIGFPISLIVMLTVATITSSITAKMRLSAMRAKEKEQQTEMLYQINDRLLSAQGDTRIAGEATSFIAQCLGRSSCVYWAPSEQPSLENGTFPYAAQDHVDVRIFYQEHVYAWVQSEMEKDNPQRAGGLNLAYPPILLFCFSAGKSVKGALAVSMQRGECSEEERQFLQLASVQLMQALRLDRLREQRQQAMIAAETEQSRNHFLRAVSHDLRTPLTSILGAGSVLAENGGSLSPEDQKRLAGDIYADAQWLLNMVQNVLLTTRMRANGIHVEKKIEAMEEVIANAAAAVRKRFSGCSLRIKAPDKLILVPMDAMLIFQVLTNLLENAFRHAGTPNPKVEVVLSEAPQHACVMVRDDGNGLSAQALASLFALQAYSAAHEADASRGFGMGLSICKAIIEAHGGQIEGQNQQGGGALFRFTLPLEEET